MKSMMMKYIFHGRCKFMTDDGHDHDGEAKYDLASMMEVRPMMKKVVTAHNAVLW